MDQAERANRARIQEEIRNAAALEQALREANDKASLAEAERQRQMQINLNQRLS